MSQYRLPTIIVAGAAVVAVLAFVSMLPKSEPTMRRRAVNQRSMADQEPATKHEVRLVSQATTTPVELSEDEISEREKLLNETLFAIATTYDTVHEVDRELSESESAVRTQTATISRLETELQGLTTQLDQVCAASAQAVAELPEFESGLPNRRQSEMQAAMEQSFDEYDRAMAQAIKDRDERNQRRLRIGAQPADQSEAELMSMTKRKMRQAAQTKIQAAIRRDEQLIQAGLEQRRKAISETAEQLAQLTNLRDETVRALATETQSLEASTIQLAANKRSIESVHAKLSVLIDLRTARELALPLVRLEQRRQKTERIASENRDLSSTMSNQKTEGEIWTVSLLAPPTPCLPAVRRQTSRNGVRVACFVNAGHPINFESASDWLQ